MTGFRRKPKYGNQTTTSACYYGHSHRSKLETSVCQEIYFREKAGELTLLQAEDHVYLTDARILYIPDFKILNHKTGENEWIEAKGFPTDVFRLKKKLWTFYGPGILTIYVGNHRSPTQAEIIRPKWMKKN